MGTNLTKVTTGSVIAVADLESNDTAIENYLNGEIKRADLNEDIVDTKHVRPPNFFGAPAPRTELVSSDVHFRQGATDIQEETFLWRGLSRKDVYIPIKGLAATVHVTPKIPGETVKAVVLACAYVREHSHGGGDGWGAASGKDRTFNKFGRFAFAELAMFHQTEDNSPYYLPGTHRNVYAGSSYASETRPSSTRSFTWHKVVTLQHGINHLYIGAGIEGITSTVNENRHGQRLWCSAMNFIVDVHYL